MDCKYYFNESFCLEVKSCWKYFEYKLQKSKWLKEITYEFL